MFSEIIANNRRAVYLHLLCNESVQPSCVNTVVLKAFSLQQLDEVFHCGSEVSPYRQLLQSHHHVSRREGSIRQTETQSLQDLG